MKKIRNLKSKVLATETLSGWGNIPKAVCKVAYPENMQETKDLLGTDTLLARGKGRSYADQATNNGHTIFKMERLRRFLHFDEVNGVLTCEAGATLADIIQHCAPKGWFPMICPGTKYVTLGGAVANDIHGKAHHVDGSFINCVLSFTIMLADGRILNASREENADLFEANFGGLGLLGIILTITIRLRKISTTFFNQKSIVAHNLEEMLQLIEDSEKDYNYSVAWIDSLAKGPKMGKGVLVVGNEAKLDELPQKYRKNPLMVSGEPKLSVPFYLPSFVLNTFSVGILNKILYWKQKSGTGIAHYEGFFFPLDMINNWNRGYGRRGFIQYQFVVPVENGKENIRRILTEITKSDCIPFLNVLKKFGKGQGLLSFPFEGFTFAIDFPITPQLKPFIKKLDALVLEAGGRIYLGKDAYLDEATFKAMYPQFNSWLDIKRKYDPENVFSSDLAKRVGLIA